MCLLLFQSTKINLQNFFDVWLDLTVSYVSFSRQMLERCQVSHRTTGMGRVKSIVVKGEMVATG